MSLVQKLYTNVREANRRGVEEIKYVFMSEALRVRPAGDKSKFELELLDIALAYIWGATNSKGYKHELEEREKIASYFKSLGLNNLKKN
ncbi:hypothetical protein FJZ53_03120 [Candidatus Woesearchaeota archaeon]|nr:hypothetical protein [Candidatus Woesearchaeota archaeon]